MFLIWLLWLTIVIGGGYLGVGYALAVYHDGVGFSTTACAILFLGSSIYCLPKLLKLVLKR